VFSIFMALSLAGLEAKNRIDRAHADRCDNEHHCPDGYCPVFEYKSVKGREPAKKSEIEQSKAKSCPKDAVNGSNISSHLILQSVNLKNGYNFGGAESVILSHNV